MKPRQRLLRAIRKLSAKRICPQLIFLLHLTCAADIAREEIYRPLQDTARLSEGKLSLLMTLKDAGGEMSIGMLAQHLGVTDATTSIMISRMLKEAQPLVERSTSKLDHRAVMVRITARGEQVLASVLPEHYRKVLAFSETLTQAEQLLLVGLLKNLLPKGNPSNTNLLSSELSEFLFDQCFPCHIAS